MLGSLQYRLAATNLPTETGEREDDATLVAQALQDRRAFTLLYHRYVSPVYRYCYRRLGSREAAEDATSLVFLKALAALPRYRENSFRAWIFVIAHNVVMDDHRASLTAQSYRIPIEMVDHSPTPEERVIAEEDGHAIRGLLARLSPDQRNLLELRLAGLTDAEIARVLGHSHGAIRTAQYRTMVRLRALLGVTAAERSVHRAHR
jgi:RNA polymerase sigma-70 factor (ECF subfamily)